MRLMLKAAVVLALTLAILIPLQMIRGTIHERQQYREQAVRRIGANYGGPQTLAGPVLVVPYTEQVEDDVVGNDGQRRRVQRTRSGQWTYFPDTLVIDGELRPDIRRSGLYAVHVYQWDGSLQAGFDVRLPAGEIAAGRVPGQPWLSIGIADVVGLQGAPSIRINGVAQRVEQGLGHADGPGVHVRLPAAAADGRLRLDVRASLRLHGTERLALLPLGEQNDLRLRSRWPHPRFDGRSPQQDVSDRGFRARWQIASLATDARRDYLRQPSLSTRRAMDDVLRSDRLREAGVQPGGPAVGVTLIDPVNPHLQADRASKYGILFVLLTFIGFFMFELIKQVRVHPIQYLLVGMALAIFFLLLLSLSEHIAFGLAYLVAALACIGLIGVYLAAVLRSLARGLGFAAMLATLYGALYGLLLSEDNALLLGSGLLFVILAAIMLLTRKVDWYQAGERTLP